MFTTVLVPLDRSTLAEQAIGQAAAIARAAQAKIELVMVYEPVIFDDSQMVPLNEARWQDDQAYLAALADELASGAGVPVSQTMLRGEPVTEIVRHAERTGADLIVMTSHGRTGLSRAWLGSVADGLIRSTNIPVLLLRPIDTKAGRDAAHRLFKHIVVALDGSARSAAILPHVVALAKCGESHVSLLNVVPPVPVMVAEAGFPYGYMPTMLDEPATDRLVETAKHDLEQVAAGLRRDTNLEVSIDAVVDGSAGRAIPEYAKTHAADIIAMATRGRGTSRLFLGSVADKVLRSGTLPLLLLRPATEGEG